MPKHLFLPERRWRRRGKIAAALAALLLLGIATPFALSEVPYVLEADDNPAAQAGSTAMPQTARAYVVSHGWHTGLVVPAAALHTTLPDLGARFGKAAYYEIGWGDSGFYRASEVTTSLALQAMFWSPGTVLHVVAIPGDKPHPVQAEFPASTLVPLCLSSNQLQRIAQFVANSAVRDATGHPVALGKGLYGNSAFYAGNGRYSYANTCNKWTAKALQSAGLDISPRFKLTADSVVNAVQAAAEATATTAAACQGE